MSVHLTQSQWAQFAETRKHGNCPPSSLASNASHLSSLVFVLALEGQDAPNESWNMWQKLLDAIVQSAQPLPSITHVELVVPSSSGGGGDDGDSMNFATYIGERAGWGNSFNNNRSFYLGENAGNWRAVPVSCTDAANRVRRECDRHVGTPYSLLRYIFAVPPFRALASALPDDPLSYAHCATMTARVLKRALSEAAPRHASAWYGPSTLFIEMSSSDAQRRASAFISETNSMQSLVEQEDEAVASDNLLLGSDDDVRALTGASCCAAIRSLSHRACDVSLDEPARRTLQKQLAVALLRYNLVNRATA